MTSEERMQAEIEVLERRYPRLEALQDGWCRIADFAVPPGWSHSEIELAFRVPANLPGEVPYGFWTRPFLTVGAGGTPSDTSGPVDIGFGAGWQQWSWQLDDWRPGLTPTDGSNMADHVRSIAFRFQELN